MADQHRTDEPTGSQQHKPGLDEKETSQGVVNQVSVKDVNTIITSDQVPETAGTVSQYSEQDFEKASSTEAVHTFPSITDRWIKIKSSTVSAGKKGDIIFQLDMPESLFNVDACSPNILPFTQFVYGKMDMSLRFVVTSNKYKCGKFIASVIPDPAGLWDEPGTAYFNTEAGIQRQFVFIDCDGSRTVTLDLNWIFHRTFIRLLNCDYKGIKPMVYMKVIVQQLSPVRVAEGQSDIVTISAFVKISQSKYAAMTYRTKVQAPVITKKIRNIVSIATHAFDDVCEELNQDKPSMFYNTQYVIPAPRIFMSQSRTLSDAIPMRMDPSKLTLYNPSHRSIIQYKSLLQIARIWGLVNVFEWKDDHKECDVLATYSIDPSDLTDLDGSGSDRHLTPLEYVTNMYMFRSGCIELRFDFVSTFFHTGVVMISIEFGKKSDDSDCCQSGSTYTKIFNLGDQKTVSITVPYIFDTVWRRNSNIPVTGCYNYATKSIRSGIMTLNSARVKIRVMNPLIANNVTKSIQVLTFARAGPNYTLKCPVQMNASLPAYMPVGEVLSNWPPVVKVENKVKTVTLSKIPLYKNTFLKQSVAKDAQLPTNSKTLVAYVNRRHHGHTSHAKFQSPPNNRTEKQIHFVEKPVELPKSAAFTEKEPFSTREQKGVLFDDDNPNGKEIVIPKGSKCHGGYCMVNGSWVVNAEVQAPNEQENQDQTEDFLSPSLPSTQHMENHCDISDMLKKPLMLMESTQITGVEPGPSGKRSVFCIPCMPPQPNIFPTKYSDCYNSACVRSSHVAITSMFRFWRGSQRFILIFHPTNEVKNPLIKVATIPHSGVRYIGNTSEFFGDTTNDSFYEKFSISNTGIPFEIVVPSINPTINVEVPFYTEVNWAMLHQGPSPQGGNAEMPWRDKMDENVGHIIIETSEDVVMDVIWQAGDDFQLAGFIGCPMASRKFIKFSMTDDYDSSAETVKYQADDIEYQWDSQWVKKHAFSFARPLAITAAGIFAPSFAMPLAMMSMAPTISKIEDTVSDASKIAGALSRVASNFDKTSEGTLKSVLFTADKTSSTVAEVCETIKSFFFGIKDIDLEAIVASVTCDALLMLKNFSWMSFSLFLVKLLCQTKLITLDNILSTAQALCSLIESYLGPVQHQAGDEGVADRGLQFLVSLLVIGFFRMVGTAPPQVMPMCRGFLRELGAVKNWSVATQITKVLSDILALFKYIIGWCCGQVDPSVEALRVLSEKKEFLKLFIEDSQMILLEQNSQFLRTPVGKMKFWVTLCNAMQIQQCLIMSPEEKASPVLSSLCAKVIQKGNDMHTLLSCAPVRYEPIVVAIEGPAGIGKSRLVDELAISMLEQIGFKSATSDIIYVRNAGTQYWNGYTSHPVIVYDDFLNLSDVESVRTQVSELYELKSCAIFNPNMASLPEKDIRANPLIVFLCLNDAFPHVDLVRNKSAFLRRRDIVLKAVKKEEYRNVKTRDIPHEVLSGYEHLEFRAYLKSDSSVEQSQPFHFDKLQGYLKECFENYHNAEKISILERVKRLQRVLPDNAQKLNIVGDPFTLFYKSILDSGILPEVDGDLVPSEQVHQYVEFVENMVRVPTIEEQIEHMKPVLPLPTIEEFLERIPVVDDFKDAEEVIEPQALFPTLIIHKFKDGYNALADALSAKGNQYLEYWEHIIDCGDSLVTAECCVCDQKNIISLKCNNSTVSCPHMVCYSCANYMGRNGPITCPLCRGQDIFMLRDDRYHWLLRAIMKIPAKIMRTMIHIISYCMKSFVLEMDVVCGDVLYCILTNMLSISIWGCVLQEFRYALPIVVSCSLLDIDPSVVLNTAATFIEEIPMPGVYFGNIDDDNASLQCDDCHLDNIDPLRIAHKPQPNRECNHHLAHAGMQYKRRNIQDAVFLAEVEKANGLLEFIPISAYPCSNHEGCPWKNIEDFRSDISRWLIQNKNAHQAYSHNIRYIKDIYIPTYIEWVPFHQRNALQGPFLQADLIVNEVPDNWWQFLTGKLGEAVAWFMANLKLVSGVFAFVGTAITAYAAFNYLTVDPTPLEDNDSDDEDEPPYNPIPGTSSQSDWYNDSATPTHTNRSRSHQGKYRLNVKFSKQNRANLSYQGPQELEATMCSYAKNLGSIVICDGEIETQWYGFVGFKYNFAVMPTHYVSRILQNVAEGKTLKIRLSAKPNLVFDYKCSEKDFKKFWSDDLVSFITPSYFPMFNNLTRMVMSEQEYSDFSISYEGYMLEQPSMRGVPCIQVRPLSYKGFVPEINVTDDLMETTMAIQNLVSYNYSRKGACGSLVLSENSKKPILGIHVAGVGNDSHGTGYAIVLTREMFEEVDQLIKINGVAENPDIIVSDVVCTSVEEEVMEEVGKLPSHLQVHIPTSTNIVPSLISVDLPKAQSEPAILTTKDERFNSDWKSPVLAGVRKYGKVVGYLDQDVLDEVCSELSDFYCGFKPTLLMKEGLQPITESEAIVGMPGVDFYDAMPLNTSAGWPWNRSTVGKYKFVQISEDNGFRSGKLVYDVRKKYDEEMHIRKQGYLIPTLFSDVLKDERRPIEKARKEGGTRIVCGSPLQYTVAVRRYWQHFAASLMTNRIKNMMAVGLNPDGPEWGMVFENMTEISHKFVAFDYSNFGPAFSSQALDVAIKISVKWLATHTAYSMEDLNIAELLLRESQHSYHTMRNVVIKQYSGAPSGNPITTILNCLVNVIYVVFIWKKLTGLSFAEFQKYCRLIVYGDDLLLTISEVVFKQFNGVTMYEEFLKHGIKVTSAKKDDNITESIGIQDVTFLKRSFLPHPTRPHQFLAPLNTMSVEECAKWVHKKDGIMEATKENAETSVRLAYTHGPYYFNEWKHTVNLACQNNGVMPVTYTWEYIDKMCFEEHVPLKDFAHLPPGVNKYKVQKM